MRIVIMVIAGLAIGFAGGCLFVGGGTLSPLPLLVLAVVGLNVAAIWAVQIGLVDFGLTLALFALSGDRLRARSPCLQVVCLSLRESRK